MNLYLVSQSQNTARDTYDSAVVIAADDNEARNMHPAGTATPPPQHWSRGPEHVTVTYLGEAAKHETKPRVVCSSFNAG